MSKIAFIGLGNMGIGMATNLVKAGHEVIAFDVSDKAKDAASSAGCTVVSEIKEAVKTVEVVIMMLPNGKIVRGVCAEIIAEISSKTLVIDCSTIDVATAREMVAAAALKNIDMIDAPVSGGVGGASAGTLTFMCGGSEEAYLRAESYLNVMGKNIFHAGDAGNGQVAKICNNMLLGIHMIGTCEAFNLAEKLGLSAQKFYDISSTASGQNWSMTSYCPAPGPVESAPSNRNYEAGFTAAMMLKDLRLAQDAATTVSASTPLGSKSEAMYASMESANKDSLDFSGIMKLINGSL